MGKYMKYELKGSYKFIFGIIAVLLIASTIIQYNIYMVSNRPHNMAEATGFRAFTMLISILVIFGAFLATFIHIVGLFRKELYEDRGYLTFTLPLSGNKILGAKILVGGIWYVAIAISAVLYNFLLATILFGTSWLNNVKGFLAMFEPGAVSSAFISSTIVSLESTFLTLVIIYLSIALSKVSVKNKKIGGLWFVIFLVLSGLLNYLTLKISEAFPYYLSFNNFKILHYYDIAPFGTIFGGISQVTAYGTHIMGYINIIGNLSQILFIVLGFLATSYLIENKVDL